MVIRKEMQKSYNELKYFLKLFFAKNKLKYFSLNISIFDISNNQYKRKIGNVINQEKEKIIRVGFFVNCAK